MRPWREFLLVLGALALGLGVAYSPTILSGGARIQTDLGDTRLVHFILEHGWRWFDGSPAAPSYWDLPLFYPSSQNTLAWVENLTGVAPLYWWLRWHGFGQDAALQAWMLCISALNFLSFLMLLRGPLRFRALPAVCGAWLFAFAALRTNQMGHQQMMPVFFSAWAAHALVRLHETRRDRYALLAGLAIGGQFLASVYLGWFFVLGLVVYLPWWLTPSRRWSFLPQVAFALAVGALLFLPVFMRYRATGWHWTYADAEPYFLHWRDLTDLGPTSWLFGWAAESGGAEFEHRLGLGFVTVLAAGVGLWRARRFEMLGAALTLCLLCTWCWPMAWHWLPGASSIRTPSRVGELLLFPLSVGLAFFAQLAPWRWLAPALVVVFLEQGVTTGSYDAAENRRTIESLARRVPADCEAFAYLVPVPRKQSEYYHLDAMWAALETGVPTVNGYSSHAPPGWPDEQLARVRHLCPVMQDDVPSPEGVGSETSP